MTPLKKKHFEAIANILGNHKAADDMVLAFANYLATTSPTFNKQKFFDACGPCRPTT